MLEAQVLITKKDGGLPAATAKVAPVCNMLSSLFETVSLRINDVLITARGSHYGYKDYIQTLLNAPTDARALLQSKVNIFFLNFISLVTIITPNCSKNSSPFVA